MATKKTAKKKSAVSGTKAVKKAAKKKSVAKKKTVAAAKAEPKKKAAVKKAAAKKTAKKAAASGKTSVTAMVDVGWGNSLYLRGDGPGLSWEKGVLMECNAANAWQWVAAKATKSFNVKFLINDDHWSSGDNLEVKVGKAHTTVPEFFG